MKLQTAKIVKQDQLHEWEENTDWEKQQKMVSTNTNNLRGHLHLREQHVCLWQMVSSRSKHSQNQVKQTQKRWGINH